MSGVSLWLKLPREGKRSFVSARRENLHAVAPAPIHPLGRGVEKARVWAVLWTTSLWPKALPLVLPTLGGLTALSMGVQEQPQSSCTPLHVACWGIGHGDREWLCWSLPFSGKLWLRAFTAKPWVMIHLSFFWDLNYLVLPLCRAVSTPSLGKGLMIV